MKRTIAGALAVVALCSGHAPRAQSHTLPQWMVGCWAGDLRGARVEERWFAAGDTILVGVGTTMAKGTLREFEFLRIVLEGASLSYIAQPGGRPPTTFRSSSSAATEVTFENPQHDFPKRIIYRRSGSSLRASVDDGTSNDRRQEYAFERVSCDR